MHLSTSYENIINLKQSYYRVGFVNQRQSNTASPYCFQIVAERMKGGEGGSIVNISSHLSTLPTCHSITYSTLKAALDQLTRMMAVELAPYKAITNLFHFGLIKHCNIIVVTLSLIYWSLWWLYPALGSLLYNNFQFVLIAK